MARETEYTTEQRAIGRLRAAQSLSWKAGTEALSEPLKQAEQFIGERLLRSNTQWQPHATALFPYESPVTHTMAVLYEGTFPVITSRLPEVPHPEADKFLALPQLVYPRFRKHAEHTYGKTNAWHDRRLVFPNIDIPPFQTAHDPQNPAQEARYGIEALWFEPSYGPLPAEVIDQVLTSPDLSLLPESLRFMEMRLKLVDFARVNERTSRMIGTLLERGTLSKEERTRLEIQKEQAKIKATKLAQQEDLFAPTSQPLDQAS